MKLDAAKPRPGLYYDTPESLYRLAEGYCQSDLKSGQISMAHLKALLSGPAKEPTADQKIGTLTHSLILCGREDFVVIPDHSPKKPTKAQLEAKKPSESTLEAIEWWEMFRAQNEGKEFVDKEQADALHAMRDSVMADPVAREILGRSGNNEVACFKVHERTGLLLKGRADRICSDNAGRITIPDLKTVQLGAARPDEFSRSIFKWGYDIQAAFYIDLFGGEFFVFVAVEKEPPYAVKCYSLKQDSIERGRRIYEGILTQILECESTGVWPSYAPGIESIGVPEWVLRRESYE